MSNKMTEKLCRSTPQRPMRVMDKWHKNAMKFVSFKAFLVLLTAALGSMNFEVMAQTQQPSPVIEVVTMKLKSGVSAAQFKVIDQGMAAKYVSKRPGFLSRESAPGPGNTWLAIIHWRSAADADASMKSFSAAPGAAQFMSMIEPNSMTMTRYGW